MSYPIIESVGIEFETDYIIRGGRNSGILNFDQEHDASIESPCYFYKNNIYKVRPKERSDQSTMGCEYKSKVFTFNTKEDLYGKICDFLSTAENLGDSYQSSRSGIHVHVCMPYNISILKSILRACAHLEQVFFYLGGMGYKNRGLTNDFAFCRPITQYGPSLVTYSRGTYVQCFKLKDLYDTDNVESFFRAYGDMHYANPPKKYTPSRYHWITLYPLLTYGTIEFRIFNKTYNPMYLYTIVKFCQQLSNLCLNNKFLTLPENSIYDAHSKAHVSDTLLNFINKYDMSLDDTDRDTLVNIINNTPAIVMNNKYCVSHLVVNGDGNRMFQEDYHPEPIIDDGEDIIYPKVVTIHNIRADGDRPVL